MVTMVSKLLLLVALLVGFENASSIADNKSRRLSFQHPSESEDMWYDPIVEFENGKDGKSGKSSKVEKKSTKSSEDGGKGKGKGDKSDKKEKSLQVGSDYEVDYEVVVKSSKKQSATPEFGYVEIGNKSSKSKGYGGYSAKSDKAYSSKSVSGYKSEKSYSKYEKGSKDGGKLPKAPTFSPAPTISPRPTTEGTLGVEVPLFNLAYELVAKTDVETEDLNELEEATKSYLSAFFVNEFEEDDFTVFEKFITDVLGFTAMKNMPVVVTYDSVARFYELSTITPTSEQLGSAVEEAFTGLKMIEYEDWLTENLPSDNIFVGSKIEFYHGGEGIPDTSRFGIGLTGIAASAVAFTLLLATGITFCKRKSYGEESYSENDKLNKSPGDMTVAGETFAGETYDGTASVSAESVGYVRKYKDEEDGTESHDVNSLKPTWSDDADGNGGEGQVFRKGIAPVKFLSAFRSKVTSAAKMTSFEDVALQDSAPDGAFQDNIMPDPSSSEDEASHVSESELSHFVDSTKQVENQSPSGNRLEIRSFLSQDSMDENTTGDLSVRDNSSSRRLRTVAEIEALLSSELKDNTTHQNVQSQHPTSRPRTVEEIETLLTADDDDTIIEVPYSDEDESIVE